MRIVYFIILFTFVWNYAKNQGLTNSLNEIADMNNVLGAKNLLPNEAVSQTINGVTFTVNSDGSITINGTASADTTLFLLDANQCSLLDDRGKSLVLSGRPTEGVTLNGGSCQLTVGENVNNTWVFHSDNGSGETFTLNSSRLQNNAYIWITSGVTLANAVFKPMLRLASIQDDTYVPYSMTNKEMTAKISNVYTKTEVNALTHGYILMGMHRVRVSSNATTTTFAELINSLYNDAVIYINTLDNDTYYQLASVRVTGNDCKYVTNDIVRTTTLSSLEQNLYMMIKLGVTLFMYYIEVRSNNASKVFKYNSDGTLTEVSTNVIGYAKNIDFYFNLYHINDN